MTTISDFHPLTNLITDNLDKTVMVLKDKYSLKSNPDFPPIGLSFRSSKDEDSSNGTMQSYFSACMAIYSITNPGDDMPPASTMVPIQAWSKPPSICSGCHFYHLHIDSELSIKKNF